MREKEYKAGRLRICPHPHPHPHPHPRPYPHPHPHLALTLRQGLGEDAQHSDSRGSLCSLAPSLGPRRPAVNRGRLWLRHEAAAAAADAAEAAGSAEAAERAVAAHLYSLRISRSVMALVESELEVRGRGRGWG